MEKVQYCTNFNEVANTNIQRVIELILNVALKNHVPQTELPSRHANQPVTMNEQGVALVSGCTPRIFSMVAGGSMSPYTVMMEVLESERYARISA